MEAIACGGLNYLGVALGLCPLRRSLGVVCSGPGTASEPAGILQNASAPQCEPRPIGPVSRRGLAGWCSHRSS
jgi:hypothetical protein